jgi:hypothetical protein
MTVTPDGWTVCGQVEANTDSRGLHTSADHFYRIITGTPGRSDTWGDSKYYIAVEMRLHAPSWPTCGVAGTLITRPRLNRVTVATGVASNRWSNEARRNLR